jgi:hypothetical protein
VEVTFEYNNLDQVTKEKLNINRKWNGSRLDRPQDRRVHLGPDREAALLRPLRDHRDHDPEQVRCPLTVSARSRSSAPTVGRSREDRDVRLPGSRQPGGETGTRGDLANQINPNKFRTTYSEDPPEGRGSPTRGSPRAPPTCGSSPTPGERVHGGSTRILVHDSSGNITHTYGYDKIGRLTSDAETSQTFGFTYWGPSSGRDTIDGDT